MLLLYGFHFLEEAARKNSASFVSDESRQGARAVKDSRKGKRQNNNAIVRC